MGKFFNPAAVEKCYDRLTKATGALFDCRKSSNFKEFYSHWAEFLIHTGGVLNALEAGAQYTPQGKQWYGNVKRQGRNDPLVRYMHQARNTEEHEAEAKTASHREGRIGIGGPGETIRLSEIRFGRQLWDNPVEYLRGRAINTSTGQTATIRLTPAGPQLVPVTYRNVTFAPPGEHKGKRLKSDHPVAIADEYLAYLKDLIEQAKGMT